MVPVLHIPRTLDTLLQEHFARYRQMAFVTGARQVGKTTAARQSSDPSLYLTWDNVDHKRTILAGPGAVASHLRLHELRENVPIVVFDEIHKYGKWKGFLKGFFDTYGEQVKTVVTGSARLDVYRRGGDSLMGRYFLYRMHPLSVGELARPEPTADPIAAPAVLETAAFRSLWEHGGYPEPYGKADKRFTQRWRALRFQQLVREDLRDLSRVQEVSQVELLATLLAERSGSQLTYSTLARELSVSVDSVKRWMTALISLYFGFLVRPWFTNVAKSLRKEPKWYLADWSGVEDPGARCETFVACHLLKAVETWQDRGFGKFELRYLRDKDKREVDFVVVRDKRPWFIVEVKTKDTTLSPALEHFQRQIKAPHAFQAVLETDPVDANCFAHKGPLVVPLRTLLGQLP